MACRKRYVGELGRPSRLLPAGGVLVGCTAHEAQKGKPGYGVMPGPTRAHGTPGQAGGGVLSKGKPAACRGGVLSGIVLGAWESHVQGEGPDGST
jgi:hypothetical protein